MMRSVDQQRQPMRSRSMQHRMLLLAIIIASSVLNTSDAFSSGPAVTAGSSSSVALSSKVSRIPVLATQSSSATDSSSSSPSLSQPQPSSAKQRGKNNDSSSKTERRQLIRQEGGRFAFDTKYGALNPYAMYYGMTAIALGVPWFLALSLYQVFRTLTLQKLDRNRRIPIFITHVWGTALMRLTGMYPKIENKELLKQFYKEKRPALFVANHNSWQDIPFLGATIGWRNYKIVAKKELYKVPILGKAIAVGGHIMVDRSNRRSQLETLKSGIAYLKSRVHLCTYPEGTRSRTGRLTEFKNGAFKMAHKAGAPVIPISIVGAAKVMPVHWMFPYRPAGDVARVVVHAPVESTDKTEEELAEQVRDAMIDGLPEDQRPLQRKEDKGSVGVKDDDE